MKKILFLGAALCATAVIADKVAIKFELPPPHITGTPKEIKSDNLEPDRGQGKLRPPIMVEPEYTKKLTNEDTKVTTSEEPVTGDPEYVVDGDKTCDATAMLQLPGGLQWVQLDLGAEHTISAICVWHDQGDDRVYKDVIMQISNDEKFADKTKITTIFNNDHDQTSKLGLGKGPDKEYRERNDGRPVDAKLTKGRYVRVYSAGSSSEPVNNYIEIEVFGK